MIVTPYTHRRAAPFTLEKIKGKPYTGRMSKKNIDPATLSDEDARRHVADATRRMGDQSWLILNALSSSHEPLPGIAIIRRVEAYLSAASGLPETLDPSTLHYSLERMEDDGLVRCEGEREVQVPGPRGTTRRAMRAVYKITGLGSLALAQHDALHEAARRGRVVTHGFLPGVPAMRPTGGA